MNELSSECLCNACDFHFASSINNHQLQSSCFIFAAAEVPVSLVISSLSNLHLRSRNYIYYLAYQALLNVENQ